MEPGRLFLIIMNLLHEHINYFISNQSRLKGSVKRSILLSYLRLYFPELSDRAMRKEIEEMIHKGYLISSSESGYSLIDNKAKLDKAVAYLDAKAEAIAIRKNSLIRNWNQKHPNTITLFDEIM